MKVYSNVDSCPVIGDKDEVWATQEDYAKRLTTSGDIEHK